MRNWKLCGLLAVGLAVSGWAADRAPLQPSKPFPLNPKTVTAAKGPIKLVLQVGNTKVRTDDSLWLRLTLTNTGNRPMKVADEAFWDVLDLAENGPLRIEVREKKSGKTVSRFKRMDILWTDELDRCVEAYEKKHPSPVKPKVWVLQPGESISTPPKPPMSDYALRACERDPEPTLAPPYGEIPGWQWAQPSYEVRAVFDDRLNPKFEKYLTEEGRLSKDYRVLLATEWIAVTRAP